MRSAFIFLGVCVLAHMSDPSAPTPPHARRQVFHTFPNRIAAAAVSRAANDVLPRRLCRPAARAARGRRREARRGARSRCRAREPEAAEAALALLPPPPPLPPRPAPQPPPSSSSPASSSPLPSTSDSSSSHPAIHIRPLAPLDSACCTRGPRPRRTPPPPAPTPTRPRAGGRARRLQQTWEASVGCAWAFAPRCRLSTWTPLPRSRSLYGRPRPCGMPSHHTPASLSLTRSRHAAAMYMCPRAQGLTR